MILFMRGSEYLIAQRYGNGRAANESETKLLNLDKKLNFKTANGRRVPLTDLLGLWYVRLMLNGWWEKDIMHKD